jgi:hypothetical protein
MDDLSSRRVSGVVVPDGEAVPDKSVQQDPQKCSCRRSYVGILL